MKLVMWFFVIPETWSGVVYYFETRYGFAQIIRPKAMALVRKCIHEHSP